MPRRVRSILAVALISTLCASALTLHAVPGAARPAAHPGAQPLAAWPAPQEETYLGCPPAGDGGDMQLNLRKNRIDAGSWQPAALASLLTLPWPASVDRVQRVNWSSSDAASVAQYEGRPVIAEGYLLLLRHEGPESPNCHESTQRDYHVWLAVSQSDSRAHAIIVELTPRVVARNPGWGDQAAILALKGSHVRIAGWLLLDQEHPEQLHATRGTLWEIHPVMQIQVQRGGKWIDLNTGKPATSSPGASATPAPTATTTTASGGAFTVTVHVQPDPTHDGTATTVSATTTPGASCTVQVRYASGSLSGSSSLKQPQTASSDGTVSWTWKPSTSRPGQATATVTCGYQGKTATGTVTFTVAS